MLCSFSSKFISKSTIACRFSSLVSQFLLPRFLRSGVLMAVASISCTFPLRRASLRFVTIHTKVPIPVL
ncbi:hypothetical protein EVA_09839 [gut metagenome]|uniref:Uncharacterized protein n=1 Tax=gut metagenome TaxID=749906 RepID=J9G5D6_9ZZZZ